LTDSPQLQNITPVHNPVPDFRPWNIKAVKRGQAHPKNAAACLRLIISMFAVVIFIPQK
jgi:hypothetical protein